MLNKNMRRYRQIKEFDNKRQIFVELLNTMRIPYYYIETIKTFYNIRFSFIWHVLLMSVTMLWICVKVVN